ncbi:DUF4365 domain-containing protein (plasmid) [Sphingobium sp. V4]|uniref:DUF4365 domain-containing protein n=1 Tax=Sphingobium sp. V4 TaxID=3038927 RepID=UPI002557D1EB|nr:DUF4365 domain-containing protein [Sphingobium sp. V4]WIW90333.1 DUF4365 domain-containing protein [Sphingobium sp. V4]
MTKTTDQTDRAGIHAVAGIFTKLNWAFREQPTSDYGIDAQAEKISRDNTASGKLIALQIKSGASYFRKRGNDFVFYGEERHREYWANHSLPVFLILHNPETGLTLWQRIERHLIEEGTGGRWAIAIPADQTLDAEHEHFIHAGVASDLASQKRFRLALDLPLIQEFAEHEIGFMAIEDWVNKTLNYRGTSIVFGEDPDGEVGMEVQAWMPGYSIDYYMAVFFPWLEWKLYQYISEEEGAYEVAMHVLQVSLSDVGAAMLSLEDYYKAELPPFKPEREIMQIRDDRDEDDFYGS